MSEATKDVLTAEERAAVAYYEQGRYREPELDVLLMALKRLAPKAPELRELPEEWRGQAKASRMIAGASERMETAARSHGEARAYEACAAELEEVLRAQPAPAEADPATLEDELYWRFYNHSNGQLSFMAGNKMVELLRSLAHIAVHRMAGM